LIPGVPEVSPKLVGLTDVDPKLLVECEKSRGKSGGIPHLAKNERDTPNFLQVDETRSTCAPFFKERRMKFRDPTKLHRKSGTWGTRVRGGQGPDGIYATA